MREGHRGSYIAEGERLSPEGSIDYHDKGCWNIKYSPTTGNFYIQTNDYHPGDLELTIEDLENMIKFAKKIIHKL